jgi:hypothetical protein
MDDRGVRPRWMKRRRGIICMCVAAVAMCVSVSAIAGKDEVVALLQAGKYSEAIPELKRLADGGDTTAMVTIGNFYYEGQGVSQSYEDAMNWWLRAADHNGDAFSNIGVLYRDGKGVARNLEIAYDIFVITHMRGLGDQGTQVRNGGNLKKAVAVMSQDEVKAALCLSEEYVLSFVRNRGQTSPDDKRGVPIKDRDWWFKGELPEFSCNSSPAG